MARRRASGNDYPRNSFQSTHRGKEYHRRQGSLVFSFEPMNDDLMPDLLLAVEQQLTSPQTPYVAKTLARLVKLGLDEAEAKSQIAICLGEQMDQILRSRKAFDEKSYRENLQALPFPEEDVLDEA